MKTLRLLVVSICLSVAVASVPRPALADEYDDSQSHPLRLVAYLAHPAGLTVEWLFFRPFHALVSAAPEIEYVFGHKPHPPMFTDPPTSYGFGVSKRDPMKETAPPKKVAAQEPTAEIVTVKEVLVEKAVLKEVTSP